MPGKPWPSARTLSTIDVDDSVRWRCRAWSENPSPFNSSAKTTRGNSLAGISCVQNQHKSLCEQAARSSRTFEENPVNGSHSSLCTSSGQVERSRDYDSGGRAYRYNDR